MVKGALHHDAVLAVPGRRGRGVAGCARWLGLAAPSGPCLWSRVRPITKCQTAMMPHEACRSLATTARVCRSARCAGLASHSDLIAGCLLTHRTAWPCAGPYQGVLPRHARHESTPTPGPMARSCAPAGLSSVSARPPPLGELRTDWRRAAPLAAPLPTRGQEKRSLPRTVDIEKLLSYGQSKDLARP